MPWNKTDLKCPICGKSILERDGFYRCEDYIDADHALAVYLPILIVGWTIIGTLFGLGVCSAIRIDLIQSLADILCAGGYAGIFLGLFGGILYLYRK